MRSAARSNAAPKPAAQPAKVTKAVPTTNSMMGQTTGTKSMRQLNKENEDLQMQLKEMSEVIKGSNDAKAAVKAAADKALKKKDDEITALRNEVENLQLQWEEAALLQEKEALRAAEAEDKAKEAKEEATHKLASQGKFLDECQKKLETMGVNAVSLKEWVAREKGQDEDVAMLENQLKDAMQLLKGHKAGLSQAINRIKEEIMPKMGELAAHIEELSKESDVQLDEEGDRAERCDESLESINEEDESEGLEEDQTDQTEPLKEEEEETGEEEPDPRSPTQQDEEFNGMIEDEMESPDLAHQRAAVHGQSLVTLDAPAASGDAEQDDDSSLKEDYMVTEPVALVAEKETESDEIIQTTEKVDTEAPQLMFEAHAATMTAAKSEPDDVVEEEARDACAADAVARPMPDEHMREEDVVEGVTEVEDQGEGVDEGEDQCEAGDEDEAMEDDVDADELRLKEAMASLEVLAAKTESIRMESCASADTAEIESVVSEVPASDVEGAVSHNGLVQNSDTLSEQEVVESEEKEEAHTEEQGKIESEEQKAVQSEELEAAVGEEELVSASPGVLVPVTSSPASLQTALSIQNLCIQEPTVVAYEAEEEGCNEEETDFKVNEEKREGGDGNANEELSNIEEEEGTKACSLEAYVSVQNLCDQREDGNMEEEEGNQKEEEGPEASSLEDIVSVENLGAQDPSPFTDPNMPVAAPSISPPGEVLMPSPLFVSREDVVQANQANIEVAEDEQAVQMTTSPIVEEITQVVADDAEAKEENVVRSLDFSPKEDSSE